MESAKANKSLKVVKFHARIVWRGFCKVMYGTAVAGLIALAGYEFVSIPSKTGWGAVLAFIAACVLLSAALAHMHFIGSGERGR